MLDKQQAKKLAPLVHNLDLWEALKEYLHHLKALELRVLVGATSELEMFRCQGKLNSLERLEQLPDEVKEALNRSE